MKIGRKLTPDIVTLQAFECAARHGSFTRAADELNLTQSAVSRQIKELESRIGVLLFERVRQRVVLSDAGRRFLPEVRRLLRQSEEMMVRAVASAEASSMLSVATLPTFGNRWLTPRLPRFLAAHPETVITVASRSRPFDLEEENFDVAIHYGQPVWARATCTFLCNEEILPVASPARLRSTPVTAPGDVVGFPLLHLTTRPRLWEQWLEMHGCDTAAAFRGHRFDQFSMIIEAAVADLGLALLPRYLIEQEIATGKLTVISERMLPAENSYYVVMPEGKRRNPLGLAFQTWLASEVGTSPTSHGASKEH